MVNGSQNRSLLWKCVYLVQRYCKKKLGGRIPAKQDIGRILKKALTDDDSRNGEFYSRSKQNNRKRHNHENPARPSLEHRGIEFFWVPNSAVAALLPRMKKHVLTFCILPLIQNGKKRLAMRESLHKAEPQTLVSANMNLPSTPQVTYIPTGIDSPMA